MKKFILTGTIFGAALGLAACSPAAEENEMADETVMEVPGDDAMTSGDAMDDSMADGAMADDGAMAEDAMADDEDGNGHGNPVDQ